MSGVKDSFTCEIEMKVDGIATAHGYTPGANVPCSDPTKGLAQITFMDSSGTVLSDAAATSINKLWMYPHPTDNWKYVYACVPGMGSAMSFLAVMWGEVPANGVLQRVHKRLSITIESDGNVVVLPP